jgi:hypothetical protein
MVRHIIEMVSDQVASHQVASHQVASHQVAFINTTPAGLSRVCH